jgi:hypothetical protein
MMFAEGDFFDRRSSTNGLLKLFSGVKVCDDLTKVDNPATPEL